MKLNHEKFCSDKGGVDNNEKKGGKAGGVK
jgi:hypothetical protein